MVAEGASGNASDAAAKPGCKPAQQNKTVRLQLLLQKTRMAGYKPKTVARQ
jgi:hypothetical protein